MGRRAVGCRVSQAAHDVRAGTHRPRDDSEVAGTRPDRALAGDQDVDPVVHLLGHVVVVAGDRCPEGHRRSARREGLPDDALQEREHHRPVAVRVLLRPEQVSPVGGHLGRVRDEHGEVAVGQARVVRERPGPLDVGLRQLVTDPARPRVQHEPHRGVVDRLAVRTGLEADLDEVVAPAERPELHAGLVPSVGYRGVELVEALPEGVPTGRGVRGEVPQLADVDRGAVRAEPHRDRLLDLRPQRAEAVGQVCGDERRADGGHAAPDVDADGCRADRVPHRDDGTDRGPLAVVDVRHHGEAVDPRQSAGVAQLLHRGVLDLRRVGPHPDRYPDPGYLGEAHGCSSPSDRTNGAPAMRPHDPDPPQPSSAVPPPSVIKQSVVIEQTVTRVRPSVALVTARRPPHGAGSVSARPGTAGGG